MIHMTGSERRHARCIPPTDSPGELPAGLSDSPMNAPIEPHRRLRRWRPSSPGWRTARPRVGDAGERKERTRARGLRQNVHHSTECPPIFGKMSAFFRQNVRRSSAKCPPDSSQHMKFIDLSRPSKEIRIQDYSRKSALLPKGGTDGNEARTRPESCPRVLSKKRLVARSLCPGAGEGVALQASRQIAGSFFARSAGNRPARTQKTAHRRQDSLQSCGCLAADLSHRMKTADTRVRKRDAAIGRFFPAWGKTVAVISSHFAVHRNRSRRMSRDHS